MNATTCATTYHLPLTTYHLMRPPTLPHSLPRCVHGTGVTPSPTTHSILIHALSQAGEADAAESMLRDMVAHGAARLKAEG